MILGIGIDLVEVERIADALARHDGRFETRVFTDDERAYCRKNVRAAMHFAARFAAKEAAWKALGLPGGLRWRDIEVRPLESGAPTLVLHGEVETLAKARGVGRLHVSLSHTESTATAMVVAEGTP